MKNLITNLLLVVSLTLITKQMSAQVAANSSEGYKVVFQLSTSDTLEQKAFIKQLHNLTDALDNVTIEVVILGPGITFIKNTSPFRTGIEKIHSAKLKFLVCRNTMIQSKVHSDELIAFAEIIPAGLAHIIKRQSENRSYIKAGF